MSMEMRMDSSAKMLEGDATPISQTVSSVTDLPIPSQKSARDSQQSPKTTPVLRRPSRIKHRPQDDIEVQSLLQGDDIMRQDPENSNAEYLAQLSLQKQPHSVHLADLPVEVQEGVIDYLAGHLIQPAPNSLSASCGPRNWSTAMRHPRRKQLSDLALVSTTWRGLIQERLYRHVKVKGTRESFAECRDWFVRHSHLRAHVRHFEVWVPIWEVKASQRSTDIPPIPSAFTPRADMRGGRTTGRVAIVVQDISDMTQSFQQASENATLEDIFEIAQDLFPEAYAMTIEGGQGKRTPLIRAYGSKSRTPRHSLRQNPQIGSLILKGAWNIVRESGDFQRLRRALPNLREYQCAYAKPKIQAYEATCCVLKSFLSFEYCLNNPPITHLNLCLEGLTGKCSSSPEKWQRLYFSYHICNDLGRVLPHLENFSFTGRVCSSFFRTACKVAADPGHRFNSRLKSVDLIIRNCCRPGAYPGSGNDATGIYQLDFIHAFTDLVVEAVRSLAVFPSLNFLRIRFLDLDSPNPLLNPYFHLQGNSVTGLYNDEIIALIQDARPDAEYDYLHVDEGMGCCGDGRAMPLPNAGRPRSVHVGAYTRLAEARM
ncbi:MAG: hypothetical protein Q9170_006175 [Blastenia crenularia]